LSYDARAHHPIPDFHVSRLWSIPAARAPMAIYGSARRMTRWTLGAAIEMRLQSKIYRRGDFA
jgi:hypothetical protein